MAGNRRRVSDRIAESVATEPPFYRTSWAEVFFTFLMEAVFTAIIG